MAEAGAIGTEEGGIVGKAAGKAGLRGADTTLKHGLSGQKALDGDIFPQRRSGGLAEHTAYLAAASEKGIGYGLEGYILKKMLVHICHKLALEAAGLASHHILALIHGRKHCKKHEKAAHKIELHISYALKVKASEGGPKSSVPFA